MKQQHILVGGIILTVLLIVLHTLRQQRHRSLTPPPPLLQTSPLSHSQHKQQQKRPRSAIMDLDDESNELEMMKSKSTSTTMKSTSIDTDTAPFVSLAEFTNLQRALHSIAPDGSTAFGNPLRSDDVHVEEIDFLMPLEETTFYDADKPPSAKTAAKFGPRLKFQGQSKSMAYMSTALFSVDPSNPEIGGSVHFIGRASFGDELSVKLHLSTPPGDSFWYVTLKDVIKKKNGGENQTPVVAYTDCKTNPWEDDDQRCRWMVHEGPEIGWKKSSTLRLTLVN
jgi:hypothetical protein